MSNDHQPGYHQPYQPQQYAQPGSGPQYVVGYQPAPPRGLSITSMVLGLASLFFGFTFVVPIVGFILGLVGIRKEPAGRGMAITGLILNGLFVLGWALLVIFVIGVGALGIGSSLSNG